MFNRYLQQKVGFSYPINSQLKALLDKVLTDVRWDLKFIGMQIVIEGLALAAFNNMKMNTACPLLRQIVHYVIRDEARHVTFGVNYLEDFVATLTDEERDERGMFAFEACVIMRERILSTDVYSRFVDAPRDEIRKQLQGTESMQEFRNLLFSRIIPNLSRIGLLTDKVRPHFDALGLLEYEEAPSDWEIDWANMEKPYEEVDQIAEEAKQMRDFSRAVMESKGIHLPPLHRGRGRGLQERRVGVGHQASRPASDPLRAVGTRDLTFGRAIAQSRKKLGRSQRDLATSIRREDGVAISPQYLNDIEHDRRKPSSDHMVQQFATELEVEADWLYYLAGRIPESERGKNLTQQRAVSAMVAFRREINK